MLYRSLSRVALGLLLAAILMMGSTARAQTYPGPTLGSGTIVVNPIATNWGGPDTAYCSFTGAMAQATEGFLDPGCANEGQYYGGGPGGWTSIVVQDDIYLPGWPTFYIGNNTSISIDYAGDAPDCQGGPTFCTGRAAIDGAGSPYVGFQVDYGAVLQLGKIRIQGYHATTLQISHATGSLYLDGTEVSGNDGQDAINQTAGVENFGGYVSIANSLIQNNVGGIKGAGILNQTGSVEISNTSITGNSVDQYGGGIMNNDGLVSLYRVTIGGNEQTGGSNLGGGGIYQTGPNAATNIYWSTITANSARGSGSGIDNVQGIVTISDSIVADNHAPRQPAFSADCHGTITSYGFNLLGNCQTTTPSADRPDALSVFSSDGTAMLEPLSNQASSGPRYYIPGFGSPALNALPGTEDCGNDTCNNGAYQQGD